MPPRVYLTGFMASGKSTVGPLLADALGYRFVDLDWLVEARAGRSIRELFSQGEGVFRAAESEALRETAAGEGLVVATGGGTLADPDNLEVARVAGAVVWLRASIPMVVRRVGRARGRPMLADAQGRPLRGRALRDRIQLLLDAREPFYAQANLVADADAAPAAVARNVLEALEGWSKR